MSVSSRYLAYQILFSLWSGLNIQFLNCKYRILGFHAISLKSSQTSNIKKRSYQGTSKYNIKSTNPWHKFQVLTLINPRNSLSQSWLQHTREITSKRVLRERNQCNRSKNSLSSSPFFCLSFFSLFSCAFLSF
jgi:hypothetical protein